MMGDLDLLMQVRKIAQTEGRVVNSVDDLICKVHLGQKFIEVGAVVDSKKGVDSKVLVYGCRCCSSFESQAYGCPKCGIVVGSLKENAAYNCVVCNSYLGDSFKQF